MEPEIIIHIKGLNFNYGGGPQVLKNINLDLNKNSRCLLVGANGSGKTTLLRILAGKHLVNTEITCLGINPFQEPQGLTFLGGEWANNPHVRKDVNVRQLIASVNGNEYPERRDTLIELLDIDLNWRLHQVSDGERRRVQMLLGLIKPFKLLLLDEVTVDLDVLVRRDLLNFLIEETDKRGATIVYATHIFDGLGDFATHLAHIAEGQLVSLQAINDVEELKEIRLLTNNNSPLLILVEKWLRKDRDDKKKRNLKM